MTTADIGPGGTSTSGIVYDSGTNFYDPAIDQFYIWILCGETIDFTFVATPTSISGYNNEWFFSVGNAVLGTYSGYSPQTYTTTLSNATNRPDRWYKIRSSANFATINFTVTIVRHPPPVGPTGGSYAGTPDTGEVRPTQGCCPRLVLPNRYLPASASALGGSDNLYAVPGSYTGSGYQPFLNNLDGPNATTPSTYGPPPVVETDNPATIYVRDHDGNWWWITNVGWEYDRQASQLRLLSYPAAGNGDLFCRQKPIFTYTTVDDETWVVNALEWSPFENCLYMAVVHIYAGSPPTRRLEVHRVTFGGTATLIWADPAGALTSYNNIIHSMIVNGDGSVWWMRWNGLTPGTISLWRKPSGVDSGTQVTLTGGTMYCVTSFYSGYAGPLPLWPTAWGDVLVACQKPTYTSTAVRFTVQPDGTATPAWTDCPLLESNFDYYSQRKWLKCMRSEDFSKIVVFTFPATYTPPMATVIGWTECAVTTADGWKIGTV